MMTEYITNQGYSLLSRMLSGECTINFTRVEMGNGEQTESDLKRVTTLASTVCSIDVESVQINEDKTVDITATFTNAEISTQFYFKEKGVFVTDGSKEILFSYAYTRDPELIPPSTESFMEKRLKTVMKQLQDTTAEINIQVKSGIYALQIDMDNIMKSHADHIADKVSHITEAERKTWNSKAAGDHTHNYAGSSSAGGAATSANKLNTNAGSATNPTYFSDGVPKACTYELNKTVPSDAVFTDTTYSVATTEKDGLMSAEDKKHVDKIGDTDISGIGDGTATGAVSELNSNMNIKSISAKEIQIENTTDSYMILKYAQRNLLPNDFYQGTYYDVKYTKNNDGSITINGTSTGTNYGLWIGTAVLDAGTYAMGTVSNASYGRGDIFLTGVNGSNNWHLNRTFTLTSRCTINAFIYVSSGVTIDNLTIYPIILKQNYEPEEYIPYKGYDITSSNSDGSKISKISITPNTTFPVTGLQSYNNLTNVKNPYGAIMEVAYANNSAGKAILDGLFNNSEIIDNSMPDKWDSTKTYYTGDYCIENNKLWKCKGMNTGASPSGSSGSTYWDKVTIASELNSKANTGYKKLLTIPVGSIDFQSSTTYTLSAGKFSDYSSILLVDHNNSYSTVPLPIFENGSKVNVGTGDVEVKYSTDTTCVISISGESAGNYGLTVYGL